MASTSPLRPIAVTRPMRPRQPMLLAIDGRPGNASTGQRYAFAVAHSHSSPLVMRLMGRVAAFGQHLTALGGRHEFAMPSMSLDVRRRFRRSPMGGVTERRGGRWPWGITPSVSIPMQHEQFVGRAVLPEAARWMGSDFDWEPAEESMEVGFSSGWSFVDSLDAAPVQTAGLAGVRPLARRASEPALLLSVPRLAHRIVADHAAPAATALESRSVPHQANRFVTDHTAQDATTMESRARQVPRAEGRDRSLHVVAHGNLHPRPEGGTPSTGFGSSADLYRAYRDPDQGEESRPTNFTLDLLRHLNWSPRYESQHGNRVTNAAVDQAVTTGFTRASVSPGLLGEAHNQPVFRTMQLPPIATPLAPTLPQSTLVPPALPLVGRRLGGAIIPGAPFAQASTPFAPSPLVSPFVADRLAQVSRLLSSETRLHSSETVTSDPFPGRVNAAPSFALGDRARVRAPSLSPAAPSFSPATMLPEMPVVGQRIAFGAAHVQRTLEGIISPVWGALGQQVQTESARATVTLPRSHQESPPAVVARRSSPVESFASYAGEAASTNWLVGMPFASSDVRRTAILPPISSRPFFPTTSPFARIPETGALAPPLVYRSPLVDRAEPDEMQRAEAGELMATSTGAPLPAVIRRSMEQRLGMDLAAVRVHSGPGVMRAAQLISARSMARGTDVFMPGGMPESPTSPDLPLLAHELTHVTHHQGQPLPSTAIGQRAPMLSAKPMAVQPLTLARRNSDQEQQADQIERSFLDTARGLGQSAIPESLKNPALTLPKMMQSGMQQARDAVSSGVDQAKGALADAAAPVTNAVSAVTNAISGTPSGPSAAELADQVYHLLERRLLVERERGGYRR